MVQMLGSKGKVAKGLDAVHVLQIAYDAHNIQNQRDYIGCYKSRIWMYVSSTHHFVPYLEGGRKGKYVAAGLDCLLAASMI